MLKKYFFAVIIACTPHASCFSNLYLKGFTGLNFLCVPSIPEASLETDVGYAVGSSLGCKCSKLFRLEAEIAYRYNDLDQLIIKGNGGNVTIDLDGFFSSFTYMANLIVDLKINRSFRPYFGAGIGGYREWGDGNVPMLQGTPDEVRLKFTNESAAYQVLAGLNLLHLRKLDAGLEYHFLEPIDDSDTIRNHTLVATGRISF